MSSGTFMARNSEIITVLCNGTGTSEQILDQLTLQFPARGWTLEQVTAYMTSGLTRGLYKKVAESPDRYQIRKDMAFVNTGNTVYQNLCSYITKNYGCGASGSSGATNASLM